MSMPSSSEAVATIALQFAALEPLLGRKPAFLRQAAVMRGDRILAETVREFAGDPLGHAAGVDEDERRAMALDQFGEAAVDLGPDLVRHHRFERRVGDFEPRSRGR